MDKLEELFNKEIKNLDELQIPQDFEQRLRNSLYNHQRTRRKKPRFSNWLVASLLFAILLSSYNYDAIAYYGKKLLGFDQILSGTLKDLNKLGAGQEIGQTFISKNGTKLTLDGLIWDKNRLVILYTMSNPKGEDLKNTAFRPSKVKGLLSYPVSSGQGKYNDDFTQLKGIFNFESPSPFEKTLKLEFALDEQGATEYAVFKFRIDKSKALGYRIKENLNKSFNIDDTKVKFTELIASPTLTVIHGKLSLNGAANVDYVTSPTLDLELWADGEEINKEGQGIRSSITGYSFDVSFDGLPRNFKNLELRLNGVSVCERVNAKVPLDSDNKGKTITISDQEIEIKEIVVKDNLTELTLVYNENVSLLDVSLETKGQKVSLTNTEVVNHHKTSDGVIQKEMLITFPTKITKANLVIGNISYPKESNLVIPLP